jgi:hypothetical protein
VTSAEQAAALVLASDPRLAGLGPQDPNLIGQCCFYTATPAADGGFNVQIEIGWGDCPAGCIDRHHWRYVVSPDGTVRLDGEDGPPVPAGIPGPGDGTGGVIGIRGLATAGPVCPVVHDPPDPACTDRSVEIATIRVIGATTTDVVALVLMKIRWSKSWSSRAADVATNAPQPRPRTSNERGSGS